jgi:hypothetical protein
MMQLTARQPHLGWRRIVALRAPMPLIAGEPFPAAAMITNKNFRPLPLAGHQGH